MVAAGEGGDWAEVMVVVEAIAEAGRGWARAALGLAGEGREASGWAGVGWGRAAWSTERVARGLAAAQRKPRAVAAANVTGTPETLKAS